MQTRTRISRMRGEITPQEYRGAFRGSLYLIGMLTPESCDQGELLLVRDALLSLKVPCEAKTLMGKGTFVRIPHDCGANLPHDDRGPYLPVRKRKNGKWEGYSLKVKADSEILNWNSLY